MAGLAALAGLLLGSTGRKDALQQAWRCGENTDPIFFSLKSLKCVKATTPGAQRFACSFCFTAVLPPGVQLTIENNKENGGGGGRVGPYQSVKAGLKLQKYNSLAFTFKVGGTNEKLLIENHNFYTVGHNMC